MIDAFVTKHSDKKDSFITGAVRDTQEGKYRFDLIGLHMLKRLSALLVRGARNYGERNWEKGQNVSRTNASLWRHVVAYQEGDRSEDHLAAIVFNAMSIIHVEEEVLAGKLPASLLDLPFYEDAEPFAEVSRTPTWHEKVVLDLMNEIQIGEPNAQWLSFDLLRHETFPSVSENEFAKVMQQLTAKGWVEPFVTMERVHPDYAVTWAVEDEQKREQGHIDAGNLDLEDDYYDSEYLDD